ncbi:hypothetical protein O1L68_44005 [Streptomyces lydicus]|nr:hypothetical protein [Streptomyces lydicus]
MLTAGTPQGAVLGDVDYALDRLRASGPILARTDAELVAMAEEAVRAWADRSADRLVSLLPVIDQLAVISGGHLPDSLPPV